MEMTYNRAKAMAIGIGVCFLLIHMLIINIFQQCGVTPMVKVNIFSIIFYIVMIIVANKGKLHIYCVGVYLEVVIHMTLAVLYTGWDSGFQVTLIGMNVLAMYGEYVGRTLKIKYILMLPFCFLGMAMYVGSYVFINFHNPTYMLPEKASFWLTIIWAIIVFLIDGFVLAIFVAIARSSEMKLEDQMYHDKLTGLPNRYYMADYVAMIQRNEGLEKYWIAIADIDDFKRINDTYGHNCGDYVLSTVGDIVTSRSNGLCCRWGGEEFIYISDNSKDPHELLESFRKAIADFDFRYEDVCFNITVTIGAASYKDAESIDTWISEADAKLYKGKQNGKNQVVI